MSGVPFYKDLKLEPTQLMLMNKDNIKKVEDLNNLMSNEIEQVLNKYCKAVLEVCNIENNLINNQIKNN
jgi:hypothetical protein